MTKPIPEYLWDTAPSDHIIALISFSMFRSCIKSDVYLKNLAKSLLDAEQVEQLKQLIATTGSLGVKQSLKCFNELLNTAIYKKYPNKSLEDFIITYANINLGTPEFDYIFLNTIKDVADICIKKG